jgi:hypothetical protein
MPTTPNCCAPDARDGEYRLTRFVAQLAEDTLQVKTASSEGSWSVPAGHRYTVKVLAEAKVLDGFRVEEP